MKMTIGKTVTFLILALSLTSCLYVGPSKPSEKPGEFTESRQDYSFIQEYEASEPFNLHLSTAGGNIQVQGYEGKSVNVSFVVHRNNGEVLDMTLEKLKEIADVVILSESGRLSIEVKEIYRRHIHVGFRVQTPFQTTCKLSTSGGNIDLDELKGEQNVSTSGGNLHLEDLTGNLEGSTSGGNIEVVDLMGNANVSTSGGNIYGENLKGDLSAHTSGGNIHLEELQGKANVSTSGGNIRIRESSGELSAGTSGGNVDVSLTKLTGKLDLETSGGSIECRLPAKTGMDLDIAGDRVDLVLQNFSGTSGKDKVQGRLNGGGIPVIIRNNGGAIDVNFE